jgi:hypothetical protein
MIDGILSNGQGLFSFCELRIERIRKIMRDYQSFHIYNYCLFKRLENNYYSNDFDSFVLISFEELGLPKMNNLKFYKCLEVLKNEGLIEYVKEGRGRSSWAIIKML